MVAINKDYFLPGYHSTKSQCIGRSRRVERKYRYWPRCPRNFGYYILHSLLDFYLIIYAKCDEKTIYIVSRKTRTTMTRNVNNIV